jgi:DNA-directed RNA polymerase subunit F
MIKKHLSHTAIVCAFAAVLGLVACGGNDKNSENKAPLESGASELTDKDEFFKDREQALKQMFFSIPAPIEIADMIKDAGFSFDKSMLNSVEKVAKYVDEENRAINLGIYAADLSYSTVFEQKQESVNYLAASKTLASALGIDGAMDEKFMERVQKNQNNKDSLLSYVTLSYQNVNAYLKEGKRTDVSALIVSGAWIESLYLSTQYAGKKGEKAMKQRVAEQTYSLDQLVSYLNLFATSDRVKNMKDDLTRLQSIYKEVIVVKGETSVEKDGNGATTIGSTETVTMSDATLAKIAAEAAVIRNKYIQ